MAHRVVAVAGPGVAGVDGGELGYGRWSSVDLGDEATVHGRRTSE